MNVANKLTQEEKSTVAKNVIELMVLSFSAGFIFACFFIVALKP